ncbi:acyl dehydratase [Pseudomonas syringae]|uniref:Acyl dehydratase n=1 Tax=Pseudomonas syringae TaxID=317 RepID=A0A9Q3ZWP0_PSESX|nr:acyl dehydratase [Pseudomonas syringae]MCF5062141.1 acyl dehydratase [Pseudomonas syringae]MCF5075512.1 acyl dehydratase [Pseudomonas syringae]MCF5118581.1 acyl dehydratase [Pseudomonas syringae]MCF5378642.1 acyl dehydratase [Pseudomonas syringae]
MDYVTQIIDPAPTRTQLLLDGVRALRKTKLDGAPLLPQERLVRPAVELSANDIAAYGRACGFRPEQGVPLSYPHVLAFPLHLMLLTRPSFPYPASGMVHLANRIRQHQRLEAGQALRLEVFCARWVAHPKGQALSIATRAYSGGNLVWESDSLYLRRDVKEPLGEPWVDTLPLQQEGLLRTQRWVLPADLGRRFAKVSGDFNPIHTSLIGAKIFGFRRAIAHGMWTLGRALAAQQPPGGVGQAEAHCDFKLPIFLPGQVALWSHPVTGPRREFEVRNVAGDKPHMRGLFIWNENFK